MHWTEDLALRFDPGGQIEALSRTLATYHEWFVRKLGGWVAIVLVLYGVRGWRGLGSDGPASWWPLFVPALAALGLYALVPARSWPVTCHPTPTGTDGAGSGRRAITCSTFPPPPPMSERGRNLALFLAVLLAADLAAVKLYDRLAPLLAPAPPEPVRTASPIYHHDLRKNVDGWARWGPHRYRFYTNNLGFRDDRVRVVPLRSDATRVLLLGDSFTEGVGLPYPETFGGILARRLIPERVELLNAAVVSYSPTIYQQKARHLIERVGLDVDAILVLIDLADIADEAWLADHGSTRVGIGQPQRQSPRPRRPLFEDLKQLGEQHSLILRTAAQLRILARSRFGLGGRRARLSLDQEEVAWDYDREAYRAYGERGLRRAAEQMIQLDDMASRHGIPMAIAVYPWPDQIFRGQQDSQQVAFWHAWAESRGLTFIDLFPLFVDDRDPEETIRAYYIPFDIHWSAAGHRLVADALVGPVRDLVDRARERRRSVQ